MNKQIRVLLVEDSKADAEIILRLIKKAGYEVFSQQLQTKPDLQNALKNQGWDVVLTDYSLPQFSAEEALETLKQSGLDLPFILVSGTVGEETAVRMMKAGANDYLLKDNLERLCPAIERELGEAKSRRERRKAEEELSNNQKKLAIAYEEARKAIKVRDDFLMIASHELKTPITSLKMNLQMMRRGINVEQGMPPKPEALAKSIDTSINQVNRLVKLIEDMMDVTRMEIGNLRFERSSINLKSLVQEVLDRFTNELSFAKCSIETNLHAEIIGNWDKTRIDQVVVNLISNAIKYAAGSKITVEASKNETHAFLSVRDNGPGIPKEKIPAVFQRYERANHDRNVVGLGLGLFICRQIIEAHGGTIRVQSEEKKGAAFLIELPLSGVPGTTA